MVEFNLLPDVKLNFIKARRLKRIVISVSVIVGAISVAIFVLLLLFVDVAQKVRLSQLSNKISSSASQLDGNKNLNSILTIQNQLQSLPAIEAQTPKSSRLFNYLSELVPVKVTISNMTLTFAGSTTTTGENSVTLTGNADSLATVNQFVDTLKFTKYTDGSNGSGALAFNTVVLSSFNYSSSDATSPAQYSITFSFDPNIFASTYNISLVVPPQTTTRSVISQPNDLFKSVPPATTANQGSN